MLLVWPEGPSRMPLACRVGPSGGASKYAVALELRSSARTRLTCQPALVLLDSWSPSQQLLKRSRDSGWSGGCQRKQNRRCAGRALRDSRQPPDWHAVGARTGGLTVLVVRYRRTYSATNRLPCTAPEVRRLYRQRHEGAAGSQVLKSPRSLAAGQGGVTRSGQAPPRSTAGAQPPPMALCLVAYVLVERERLDHGGTWRQLKRRRILQGRPLALPALERVRAAA